MYKFSKNRQIELTDFNQPFGMKLNPENRWVKKAELIPWDEIEDRYAELFPSRTGQPAKPLRFALFRHSGFLCIVRIFLLTVFAVLAVGQTTGEFCFTGVGRPAAQILEDGNSFQASGRETVLNPRRQLVIDCPMYNPVPGKLF